MKLKLLDRLVAALSGLIVLFIGLGLLVFGVGLWPFRLDLSFMGNSYLLWQRAAMVAAAVLLCFMGLRGVALLFRSGREKGFIAQHTEYGDLSISMSAMENMVKKCVDSHSELKVSNTRIHHARDGVVVSIRISLANGVNIPLAVSALQKQIKQYITSCSGVDVKEVRVMVETNNSIASASCPAPADTLLADADAASKAGVVVNSLHEAAQNAMPKDMPPEEPAHKKPFHQRMFKREEKPQIVPQPPVSVPKEEIPAEPSASVSAAPSEPETQWNTEAAPQLETTEEPTNETTPEEKPAE